MHQFTARLDTYLHATAVILYKSVQSERMEFDDGFLLCRHSPNASRYGNMLDLRDDHGSWTEFQGLVVAWSWARLPCRDTTMARAPIASITSCAQYTASAC